MSQKSVDEKNNVIYSCTLLEAYPLTITGLTLNWANRDEAMKLSVTMAYRKWERVIGEIENTTVTMDEDS